MATTLKLPENSYTVCIYSEGKMMATHMRTAKGDIDFLNRYGIADAARIRITAQMHRNVARPAPKQSVQPLAPTACKAKTPD